MSWVLKLWEDLKTPEDFSNDLYKFSAVALAKAFVGMTISSFFPIGLIPALLLTLAYLLLWELLVQGWSGRDTLEDTLFFFVGALGCFWLIWVTLILLLSRKT